MATVASWQAAFLLDAAPQVRVCVCVCAGLYVCIRKRVCVFVRICLHILDTKSAAVYQFHFTYV